MDEKYGFRQNPSWFHRFYECEPLHAFGPTGDFSFEREVQFERYLKSLPNYQKDTN